MRTGELIDTLGDLLIGMVHRVARCAEVRVERELIADYKRVSGKNGLLFQIAEASLDHPDEPVKEVVYPIANESTLRDLVREFKATGPAYRQQLHYCFDFWAAASAGSFSSLRACLPWGPSGS